MKIEISKLNMELQTRAKNNDEVIQEYAEQMKDGVTFPNVKVFRENKNATPYLVDGFHRTAATALNGGDTIEADIIYGDRAAALTYALKANIEHGLRRNNADKRHALELAWNDRGILFKEDEKGDKAKEKGDGLPTSRQLAALCGVSDRLAAYFIEEKGVCNLHNTSDATTCTEDHLEERNPNVLRNLKDGKDRFGVIIPEKILPAFLSTEPKRMLRDIRRLRKQLETALGNADIAFAAIGQQTLTDFDNVVADFKFGTPFCVCRACRGEGCGSCSNHGFQTIAQYRRLPREYRVVKK